MRTNIPSFRLPAEVLNDEIDQIVDMGVDLKLNHPIKSMRELLDKGGFDAVFVGAGAPKGKELKLPGRAEGAANIHIGITWLESVAFEHIKSIGKKVLIIGVGNTAMDCCRTSLRLGADEVKVMARKPRQFFKASEWELEDAEEEHVKIIINRSPKAFVLENGKLKGMTFDVMEYDIDAKGASPPNALSAKNCTKPTTSSSPSARRTPSHGSSAISASSSTSGMCPRWTRRPSSPRAPACYFGGDAAFGPKNIIWAVEHGHQAAISIHNYCQGKTVSRAAGAGRQPAVGEDGHARVGLCERLQPGRAAPHAACVAEGTLQEAQHRGRAGVHGGTDREGSPALPELRRADGVRDQAVHRMRCLHRHLPGGLPDHHAQR